MCWPGVQLLSRSRDPLARSAFLNVCAGGLVLSAHYEDALRITERQVNGSAGVPARLCPSTCISAKSGGKTGASCVPRVPSLPRPSGAPGTRNARSPTRCIGARDASTRLPLLRRLDEAMTAASYGPSVESSKAARAEVSATRSLIRACAGEGKVAAQEAQRATTVSRALEVTILSSFALAIAACGSNREAASRGVEAAIAQAVEADALDYFVVACRGFPSLVDYVTSRTLACSIAPCHPGPGSSDIAQDRTNPVSTYDPASQLSPRETEVFELLSQGLTNKEIAHTLVVSESTAKAHVRHILEKLGVKTRTAAAALSPERRRLN